MKLIGPCAVATLAAAFAVAPPRATVADEALSLYQAMEIVTGTDLRERPRGFAICLQDVLVKLSGDPRLRADPRVAELKRHAGDYVASFNYVDPIAGTRPKDDQGTYDRSENLTVTFDQAKIDALLASLGDRPWHGPRPVLIPVLSVHGRRPPAYLLSAGEELAAEQRAAFKRVANEAGITLSFPAASDFRKWGVGTDAVPTPAPCVAKLTNPNGANPKGTPKGTIVVLGVLDWSEAAAGWVGTWRTCWKGEQHVWTTRGVGYDQAFETIVQGAVLLAAGRGNPETLSAPAR